MTSIRTFLLLLALSLASPVVHAGTADEDWAQIVALDAGPGEQPRNPQEATQMITGHLARQDQALRGFLAGHPQDSRVFEAKLRLSRLLLIRADFEGSEKLRADSKTLLDQLEKIATPEQRAEVDFARVSRVMRGMRSTGRAQRDEILNTARTFQVAHPSDRRIAALLTEVAVLFDDQAKTKVALLEEAGRLTTDPDLKSRIADDLKRVGLLGQELSLTFTSLQGPEVNLASLRGKPVFIVYFADFSPPSLVAVDRLKQELTNLKAGSAHVVGISLDVRREALSAVIKNHNILWPIAFDGKSWQSPLARDWGINALPTVWLLDARGRLRSLNGLESAAEQARRLILER